MKVLRCFIASILLIMAWQAKAGFPIPELLSTDPAEPRANQAFDLVYTLEFCGDTFAPDFPQNWSIDVADGVIRITARYALDLCFEWQYYPPTYRWRVGPLPAGTYQMELYGYNEQTGPEVSFPIATGEVTIAPAIVTPRPNMVPVASPFGLLCLLFLTMLTAAWRMRGR